MINILRVNTVLRAVLVAAICSFSPSLLAQATEQKVWIKAVDNGSQCEVSAYFKGDKDNCNNKKANGREDCAKDEGCVCTRQEKHITWQMDGKESFTIEFDEGDTNPFITTPSLKLCEYSKAFRIGRSKRMVSFSIRRFFMRTKS